MAADHVSDSIAAKTDETSVRRAGRYAFGAVGLSFAGNGVHLVTKLDERSVALAVGSVDVASAPELVAEALIGPIVVLISTHLLLHADLRHRAEAAALWIGALGGFVLSAVHLYLIGVAVGLGFGAVLLPVATESASVGSILQYVRARTELERAGAAAEARAAEERQAERDRAEADREAAQAKREAEVRVAKLATERDQSQVLVPSTAASANVSAGGNGRVRKRVAVSSEDVAAFFVAHPESTHAEAAAALGCSTKTIQRHKPKGSQ